MKRKALWIVVALALAVSIPASARQAAPEQITQGPTMEGVGDTWAVIAWTTNTGGSSVVRYGTSAGNLDQTAQSPYADNEKMSSQNHRVRINHLQPGTTYYYIVVSGQGEGTGTQAQSAVGQFTTKANGHVGAQPMAAGQKDAPVKITDGPRVEGVGSTWAVVAWTTNSGSSSVVRYGTDANNLSQTAQAAYADNDKMASQNHRVHINNLKPGTTYYFMADSGQGEGTGTEAKSAVGQFTTKNH